MIRRVTMISLFVQHPSLSLNKQTYIQILEFQVVLFYVWISIIVEKVLGENYWVKGYKHL